MALALSASPSIGPGDVSAMFPWSRVVSGEGGEQERMPPAGGVQGGGGGGGGGGGEGGEGGGGGGGGEGGGEGGGGDDVETRAAYAAVQSLQLQLEKYMPKSQAYVTLICSVIYIAMCCR